MSCTTFVANDLAVVNLNDANLVGHFKKEVTVNKFLGSSGGTNVFNFTARNGEDLIYSTVMSEVMKNGGSGAINVSIEYKATFLNMLVNSITSNIWAPTTLIIEGDVIR